MGSLNLTKMKKPPGQFYRCSNKGSFGSVFGPSADAWNFSPFLFFTFLTIFVWLTPVVANVLLELKIKIPLTTHCDLCPPNKRPNLVFTFLVGLPILNCLIKIYPTTTVADLSAEYWKYFTLFKVTCTESVIFYKFSIKSITKTKNVNFFSISVHRCKRKSLGGHFELVL